MYRPLDKFNAILLTVNQNFHWYVKIPLFILLFPLFIIYGICSAVLLIFCSPYRSFEFWKIHNQQGTVVVSYNSHLNFKRNIRILSLASSVLMIAFFAVLSPFLSTHAAAPSAPANLGSTEYINGSSVTDSSPSLNFTLSDPDNDQVQYHIQIDDSADFGSLIIDYTSGLAAVGSRTFTVGQVAGDGTYTVGTPLVYLPYGSYYWRVLAIDNNAESSTYTVANGGSVAFALKNYTVTKTADTNDGTCNADCSLREAITLANASADTNKLIEFNIPATDGGCVSTICTITPTSALPAFSANNIILNGYSQTGAIKNSNDFPQAINAEIKIVLDGISAGATRGLAINNKSGNIIKGLSIIRFSTYGILISNASSANNKVQGCFVGVRPDGTTAAANTSYGVSISAGANYNIVGTDGDGFEDATERNLISGNNSIGVSLGIAVGTNNTIAGNFIGTDKTGTTDLGNNGSGIKSETGSNNNTIGTDGDGIYDQAEGNLLSGNLTYGYYGSGNADVVAGNIVGCDATGNNSLQNDSDGINIVGNNARIGTNADGVSDVLERNYICGIQINPRRGLILGGSGSTVKGNYFGMNFAGTAISAPSARNLELSSNSSNTIIGTDGDGIRDEIEGNLISGGKICEIIISGGTNQKISGNILGLNAAGNAAVNSAESQFGVRIFGGNAVVVGTNADGVNDAIERNIIAGHSRAEILFEGTETNAIIAGNYIGTDITGQQELGFGNGMQIGTTTTFVSGNRIGTNGDGVNDTIERNIISGNLLNGIDLINTDNNIIAGNYIGVAADGSTALGNEQSGIFLNNSGIIATNNTIGGDTAAEANIIANNGFTESTSIRYGAFLSLPNSDGNKILRNSFYNNFDQGIKLNGDGANNDIASPRFLYEAPSGADRVLRGSAKANSLIQFFTASSDNEGQAYIGEATADGTGAWNTTLAAPIGDIGKKITATATDNTDGTSEFSTAYTIAGYDGNVQVKFTTATSTVNEGAIDQNITLQLNQSNYLNTNVDYTITGGTAAGSGSDYTLANGTANISAGNTSVNVSFTLNDDLINEGAETIIITLSNPVNASLGTPNVHTVTINDNDSPPIVSDVNQTIDEDNSYSSNLTHTNGSAGPFVYYIISSTTHGNLNLTNSSTGAFTYQPNANYYGTDSFTYKVNDGIDDSNIATFNFTINSINDAPVFTGTIGVPAWDQDHTANQVFDLDNYFSDVDNGDTCAYSLVDDPAPNVIVNIDGDHKVSFTPKAGWSGTETVQFRCTDLATATVQSNVINLTVNFLSDLPVAVFNNVAAQEASTITLDGSASYDALQEQLYYGWTEISDSADSCSLVENNIAKPNLILANRESNYDCVYQLIVNDGNLNSAPVSGTISVAASNDPPILITISDKTVQVGTQLTFAVGANDADTANLSLAIADTNNDFSKKGLAINDFFMDNKNNTGTFSWQPDTSKIGSYVASFLANDGTNTVSDLVNITVVANAVSQNHAPVYTGSLPNISFYAGTTTQVLFDLDDYFTDEDADSLSYTTTGNTNVTANIINGEVTLTAPIDFIGSEALYFIASDGQEITTSNPIIINVAELEISDIDHLSGTRSGKGTIKVYDKNNNVMSQWDAFSEGGVIPKLGTTNKQTLIFAVKYRSGTTMNVFTVTGQLIANKHLSPNLHWRKIALGNLDNNKLNEEIVIATKRGPTLYFKIFNFNAESNKFTLLKRNIFQYLRKDYRLNIENKKILVIINGKGKIVYRWQPFQ